MKHDTPGFDPYPDHSWINEAPSKEEIQDNPDGSQFIPIAFIEQKLTRLDPYWGTENFKFQFLRGASGLMLVDASIEVVVSYGGRTRRLVGAVTLLIPADTDFTDPFVNSNYSATAKSLCTSNAVKPIGANFGQLLNDRGVIQTVEKTPQKSKQKPPPVHIKPDDKIQLQYNTALELGRKGLVNAIKVAYPSIEYTGQGNPKNLC